MSHIMGLRGDSTGKNMKYLKARKVPKNNRFDRKIQTQPLVKRGQHKTPFAGRYRRIQPVKHLNDSLSGKKMQVELQVILPEPFKMRAQKVSRSAKSIKVRSIDHYW